MNTPVQYLGLQIKDDDFVRYLEDNDLKIWYDIDLLHENMPDKYWVQNYEGGVCFLADDKASRINNIYKLKEYIMMSLHEGVRKSPEEI